MINRRNNYESTRISLKTIDENLFLNKKMMDILNQYMQINYDTSYSSNNSEDNVVINCTQHAFVNNPREEIVKLINRYHDLEQIVMIGSKEESSLESENVTCNQNLLEFIDEMHQFRSEIKHMVIDVQEKLDFLDSSLHHPINNDALPENTLFSSSLTKTRDTIFALHLTDSEFVKSVKAATTSAAKTQLLQARMVEILDDDDDAASAEYLACVLELLCKVDNEAQKSAVLLQMYSAIYDYNSPSSDSVNASYRPGCEITEICKILDTEVNKPEDTDVFSQPNGCGDRPSSNVVIDHLDVLDDAYSFTLNCLQSLDPTTTVSIAVSEAVSTQLLTNFLELLRGHSTCVQFGCPLDAELAISTTTVSMSNNLQDASSRSVFIDLIFSGIKKLVEEHCDKRIQDFQKDLSEKMCVYLYKQFSNIISLENSMHQCPVVNLTEKL